MDPYLPVKNPRIVDCGLTEGEVVLLHLESGAYHELNAMGAVIWELLDGERSIPQIARDVRERLDDPPDDLEEIVTGFVDDLRERDLVA